MTENFASGGKALWAALLAQDVTLGVTSNPVRQVAVEACRAKDRCDALDVICRTEPPMLTTDKGSPTTHPAYAEARQQANILKQLVASLRLPDEATGRRPQRHLGAAGTRQPSTSSARARLRAVEQ